jgi:hypothetical protein
MITHHAHSSPSSSVGTGYGQPSGTLYDWAIEPTSLKLADYRLPDELHARLRIEKLCDRITRSLYGSQPDGATVVNTEKLLIVRLLENELRDLEIDLRACSGTPVDEFEYCRRNYLVMYINFL